MSVVNDVALVCAIASPLLLEVAKISLWIKHHSPQRNVETNIQKKDRRNPVFGHLPSKTIWLFQNGSKIRNVEVHWPPCYTLNNVSAVSLCVFVSLAKTSRVHYSVRHPIVESANKRLF